MTNNSKKTNIKVFKVSIVLAFMLFSKVNFILSGRYKQNWVRYVLVWSMTPTSSNRMIEELGKEMDIFRKRGCLLENCFVTRDDLYFENVYEFDAILFFASELSELPTVPTVRYDYQNYVFIGDVSAAAAPVKEDYNSFFNWTWSYKIDSDIQSGDVVIKNKKGKVIGPKKCMKWKKFKKMKPISSTLKKKLKSKKFAAIWFSSNCVTTSRRELFIFELQKELLIEYNLELRICGVCGEFTCPKERDDYCLDKVETDYYFYLAFENVLSEDFVTERLVNALLHYAVPIVYGGANYSRFLPAHSYIDASHMSADELAELIASIIKDKKSYYEFFRWRNYYSYHHRNTLALTDSYCQLCAMLNDLQLMQQRRAYKHLVKWWNEPIEWSEDLFDKQAPFKFITTYVLPNETLKKSVIVKNPESLLIRPSPSLDEEDEDPDSISALVVRLFKYIFMSE